MRCHQRRALPPTELTLHKCRAKRVQLSGDRVRQPPVARADTCKLIKHQVTSREERTDQTMNENTHRRRAAKRHNMAAAGVSSLLESHRCRGRGRGRRRRRRCRRRRSLWLLSVRRRLSSCRLTVQVREKV